MRAAFRCQPRVPLSLCMTWLGGSDDVRTRWQLERILNATREFDLSQSVYSLADAAVVLGTSRNTLGRWLDGGEHGGRHYGPVIRARAPGCTSFTGPEPLKAGLLPQYRRKLQVRRHEARSIDSSLHDELGIVYRPAYAAPWVSAGRRPHTRIQKLCELHNELCLITLAGNEPAPLVLAVAFSTRLNLYDKWMIDCWQYINYAAAERSANLSTENYDNQYIGDTQSSPRDRSCHRKARHRRHPL